MALEISTPALLFPAISLLLLAYTNRFLALATIIRKLHDDHLKAPNAKYIGQIDNLRRRILLIRDMQTLGVGSLLSCTLCMAVLFAGLASVGTFFFWISLALMVGSLTLSIVEIRMSIGALELHLQEIALQNVNKE